MGKAVSDQSSSGAGNPAPPPTYKSSGAQPKFSAGLGIFLLLCALGFYWGAVLRFPIEQTKWLDLRPYPDATEYFAQASSIDRFGFPSIQIGKERLPSRFPPGYPFLMLPWLHLPNGAPVLAPFRTNQTLGLLMILGTYLFYLSLRRPLAAGLAALTLATLPAFVTFSHSSLSDLAGAGISLLAFGLIFLGLSKRRRIYIYLAAAVLGFSILVRPQLIFLSPMLIAMALFPGAKFGTGRWLLHCILCVLVFCAAASPFFMLNYLEFGSALQTGYNFWVPGLKLFSLHNIPLQLGLLFGLITATWPQYSAANLFGTGAYIVPAYFLLALIGIAFVPWSRFFYSALLSVVTFCGVTLAYLFLDGRFYMPVFFLMLSLIVPPVEVAILRLLGRKWSAGSIAILALFLLTCTGYPSQSGFKPVGNRVQARDAFRYWSFGTRSHDYDVEQSFAKHLAAEPGLVFSDVNPVYLNALLPAGFTAAPIDEKHVYNHITAWRYGAKEARGLASDAVAKHLPVYALLNSTTEKKLQAARLPVPDGHHWEKNMAASGDGTTVMKLVSNVDHH